jgi:hypothetical protein
VFPERPVDYSDLGIDDCEEVERLLHVVVDGLRWIEPWGNRFWLQGRHRPQDINAPLPVPGSI